MLTIFNLDVIPALSLDCVMTNTFYSSLVMTIIYPCAMCALIGISWLVLMLRTPREDRRRRRKIGNRHIKFLLLLLFLIYPSASATVLRTFKCIWLDDDWYLEADLRLLCYNDEWSWYASVAVIGILMYPVGVGIFFARALYLNRMLVHLDVDGAVCAVVAAKEEHESLRQIVECGAATPELVAYLTNKLMDAKQVLREAQIHMEQVLQQQPAHQDVIYRYGFIFEQYNPDAFYWELLELLRKLMLTSLIMFVDPGSTAQLAWALAISTSFLVALIMVNPFKDESDGAFAFFAMLSIIIATSSGLVLRAQNAGDETTTTYSNVLIQSFLLGATAGMVLLFAYFCGRAIKDSGDKNTDRLSNVAEMAEMLDLGQNAVMGEVRDEVKECSEMLRSVEPAELPLTMAAIFDEIGDMLAESTAALDTATNCASDVKSTQYREESPTPEEMEKGLDQLQLDLERAQQCDKACGRYAGIEGKKELVYDIHRLLRPTLRQVMVDEQWETYQVLVAAIPVVHLASIESRVRQIPMEVMKIGAEFAFNPRIKGLLISLAAVHTGTVLPQQELASVYTDAMVGGILLAPRAPQTYSLLQDKLPALVRGSPPPAFCKYLPTMTGMFDLVKVVDLTRASMQLCAGGPRMCRLLEQVTLRAVERVDTSPPNPLLLHILEQIGAATTATTIAEARSLESATQDPVQGEEQHSVDAAALMKELEALQSVDELFTLSARILEQRVLERVLFDGSVALVCTISRMADLAEEKQDLLMCTAAVLTQRQLENKPAFEDVAMWPSLHRVWMAAVSKDSSLVNSEVEALAKQVMPWPLFSMVNEGGVSVICAALLRSLEAKEASNYCLALATAMLNRAGPYILANDPSALRALCQNANKADPGTVQQVVSDIAATVVGEEGMDALAKEALQKVANTAEEVACSVSISF